MTTNTNLPSVSVKKKNIQLLLEYCLENKIEITVSPKNSEEFKITFNLKDFNSAIALGMCLRELKIDLAGVEATPVAAIKAKKTTNGKDVHFDKPSIESMAIEGNSLNFDLDAMN